MEAVDKAALKLITDEEFDFELVCSPAAAERHNILGNAVDPRRNPEHQQQALLNAVYKEGSRITCHADSPISDAALMQIFSDAQNVASDIENCRLLAKCYTNRLCSDGRASDAFDCSPNVLVSLEKVSIVDDDSFQLMPALCGTVTQSESSRDCVKDVTVSLDTSSQAHDTAIADLRSRLEHIKSQAAITSSHNVALMDDVNVSAVVGLSSDDLKVGSTDVKGDCFLSSARVNQLSLVSDSRVLGAPEYSPDVLTFQETSSALGNNSFELMPDLCAAVMSNDVEKMTSESGRFEKQSHVINSNRQPPRRSMVEDARTTESQSSLARKKPQCRLSMIRKSQNTPVLNRGTQPVGRSSSLRFSTSHQSQSAPVQNCAPTSVSQPVIRSSSLHLSTKSRNAPAEDRIPGQPVVRSSSLRRIPSFRHSRTIKKRSSAENMGLINNMKVGLHTPSKAVSDTVDSSSNVGNTPEQNQPAVMQQGTITKDRTRRLESVAGPDVTTRRDTVQRTNNVRRSLPVHHATGDTHGSASGVTTQKSSSLKSRTSCGTLSARPGCNSAGYARKSLGTMVPPRCTTTPLKATVAPPKAVPPVAAVSGLRPSVTVKRPNGLLRKPVIKKPMTKLDLVKPGPLLCRPTVSTTRGSAAPTRRQAGKEGGPLKAMLPLTAAIVQQGNRETGTCAVPVTKTIAKPAIHGSGLPTLMLTPVSEDKNLRPKRLMHAGTPSQPNRTNSASSVRRSASFLPTPTKRRSCCTSRSSDSSSRLTSSSSVDSSVFSDECRNTPITHVLTALSGLDPNGLDPNGLDSNSSPNGLKLRRPRVQHTPVNKENIAEPRASVWSPVQRPRALSREEEATQCTKRSAPMC